MGNALNCGSAKGSAAGNPAIYPPLDSPQRLDEELGLSRDFLLEPSAGNLTDMLLEGDDGIAHGKASVADGAREV